MNNMQTLASVIAAIAGTMADHSCGMASAWGMYQPKEPVAPKKEEK